MAKHCGGDNRDDCNDSIVDRDGESGTNDAKSGGGVDCG